MSSHTATGEWQSFEVRMRRRRVERLLIRADAATEAGCVEDAAALTVQPAVLGEKVLEEVRSTKY